MMMNNIGTQNPYTQPSATVGAVNIQIYNPTVNSSAPQIQPMPYAVPYQSVPARSLYAPAAQYPQNYNNQLQMNKKSEVAAPSKEAQKTEEKDKKDDTTKEKVLLTDDYIKSLENYLNNSNPKIRLMGAKELLERFKEDKTRSTDVALTALLNKTLQDPTASIRFVGLTALDVGYAKGNDETVNILKQIQQNSSEQYGEDALLASQVLLNMSAKKVEVPAEAKANDKV